MDKVTLHTCNFMWIHGPHPCYKVQKALDEAGIAYEVVKHPARKSRRTECEELTGQRILPAIERADGTILREESDDLAARIRAGRRSPRVPAS
jgi:glutathione S-transferase